jgi:hypothetical protein
MTHKKISFLIIGITVVVLIFLVGWLGYTILFPSGRIIFKETGKFYGVPVLVTIKPNGENGRVLLNNYQWKPITNFSVSRDKKMVAFASYDDFKLPVESRTTNIYLIREEIGNLGTSFYGIPVLNYKKAPKTFCQGAEKSNILFSSITWSSDGNHLAFKCPLVNSTGIQDQLICVADMESNISCWNVSTILEKFSYKGALQAISWSPKVDRLMLQFSYQELSQDGDYFMLDDRIYLVDIDGRNAQYLANGHGAGWSQNGKEVAYFAYDNNKDAESFSIYIINVNTFAKRKIYTYKDIHQTEEYWLSADLLRGVIPNGELTWSPDGFHLAFTATTTTTGLDPAIYVLNILTKNLTWISVRGGGSVENPIWIR